MRRHPLDLRDLDPQALRSGPVLCARCGQDAFDAVHAPPPLWPQVVLLVVVLGLLLAVAL